MKTNFFYVPTIASLTALSLAAIAAPVAAQTAGPDAATPSTDQSGGVGVADIIVTANKRSESVNSVPMSITAVTGDQLSRAGIKDVGDLVKIVPGFNAVNSGFNTPVYYIRGVGFFETSLLSKPTVGVYMDEVSIPFPVITVGATFDLERVEVLKGPQGTLFGSNATGGAINYIAAKPTSDFAAGLDGSFGRFAEGGIQGFISGPLSSGLTARLSVGHQTRGNWQKSTTRNEGLGERNFTQGRLQLHWDDGGPVRANLAVNAFYDGSDTTASQFIAAAAQTPSIPLRPALLTYPIANDNARQADWGHRFVLVRDNWMVQTSLRVDAELSKNVTLTSLTAYSHYKQDQGQDVDGTSLVQSDTELTGKINSLFQELRATAEIDGLGTFVFGGNYERSKGNEQNGNDPTDQTSSATFVRFGFPRINSVPQQATNRYTSKAVFANANLDITDMLSLNAGARYTETETRFSGCILNSGNGAFAGGLALVLRLPVPAPGTCATVSHPTPTTSGFGRFFGKLPEHNVSWRAGIDFKPAAGQLLYVNVSRGYKSGGFSNLNATDFNQYKPVTQEKLTAYEVGFKSSLMNRAVQINGALFYYDYTDKQLKARTNVPIFNFLEALVNIPKSRVKGGEIQLTLLPVTGLRLSGSAIYLDTRITSDFVNFTTLGQQVNFKGFGFANTPHWQVNGDADYRWPISSSLEASVGASVTYRSGTYGDFKPDPLFRIDGYTLIDLRGGVAAPDGAWRIELFGRNITNKYYWTTVTKRGDSVIRFAGMPVTYGVSFGVKF